MRDQWEICLWQKNIERRRSLFKNSYKRDCDGGAENSEVD